MADVKETKAPAEPALVEVKLAKGAIDHNVVFEKFTVEFKAGVAKVEKSVAKLLKEIGLIE